jgi:hypothetical protein
LKNYRPFAGYFYLSDSLSQEQVARCVFSIDDFFLSLALTVFWLCDIFPSNRRGRF